MTQGGTAGFIDLRAQKAWTVEVGTRGQEGIVNWELVYYRAWLKDEILKFTTGAGIPATGFNAEETIHQGVEAGLGILLARNMVSSGDSLKWNNVYTYSNFYFDDDVQFGDNKIPGVPPHVLRTELRYDHRNGWFVAVNADAVSNADVDFVNQTSAPAYALMGFGAGYDVNPNLSLFVTGRNLLDTNYISNFSTAVAATSASALYYPATAGGFLAA